MRFDTPVYFQKIAKGKYDASTGNYSDDIVEETLRYANVTDTGTQSLMLIYGTINQGSLTGRLQNHYNEPFDRLRIGSVFYKVDSSRKLRTKHVLVVSEVQ